MIKENEAKTWNADLYLRLSQDDRDKSESNSIKNQRELLLDFVSRNPDICVVNTLADDGFTGANFDRDAFKEMIRHIDDGSVNCVIVKDFSRLGRDHIETGKYIERYFATKKVRFIAVNESYDSLKADMSDAGNSLIVPFKNIINEAFLEDISVKTKTQLEIKRKNGELVCNYAVYGYKKQDGKLTVDDYAADIVKSIFDCKITGYNEGQIAAMLNAKGILSPAEYKKAMGVSYHTPFTMSDKAEWSPNAVKRILTNRVYIGHLEQGKRTKVSYRVKKCLYKPRESWNIHEYNHEPIIFEQDFELVQELLAKDTRVSSGSGQLQLFSGLIICGACGQPMTVKLTKKKAKTYINYICSTHKRHGTCKNNNISSTTVEKYTLLSIQKQIADVLSLEELYDGIAIDTLKARKKAAIEGMIDKTLNSIQEYNEYLVKSCTHMLNGIISEGEYKLFRDDFRRQIESAEKSISNFQGDIERLADDKKTHELIDRFKAHGNISELNRRVVVGFINFITVHDNKNIDICFRYASGFETLSENTEYEAVQERTVL